MCIDASCIDIEKQCDALKNCFDGADTDTKKSSPLSLRLAKMSQSVYLHFSQVAQLMISIAFNWATVQGPWGYNVALDFFDIEIFSQTIYK